mmetsp:Transcript_11208/g.28092  ORF Transcript_11208/g.28092 Transcript_11208/m.28092 type:complete len:269 (-) Transcript_11208:2065-2871(-)
MEPTELVLNGQGMDHVTEVLPHYLHVPSVAFICKHHVVRTLAAWRLAANSTDHVPENNTLGLPAARDANCNVTELLRHLRAILVSVRIACENARAIRQELDSKTAQKRQYQNLHNHCLVLGSLERLDQSRLLDLTVSTAMQHAEVGSIHASIAATPGDGNTPIVEGRSTHFLATLELKVLIDTAIDCASHQIQRPARGDTLRGVERDSIKMLQTHLVLVIAHDALMAICFQLRYGRVVGLDPVSRAWIIWIVEFGPWAFKPLSLIHAG